jgi:peptide chain release factor 1
MSVTLADKLDGMERRFAEVEGLISNPQAAGSAQFTELLREHGRLAKIVGKWRELRAVRHEIREARAILEDSGSDEELRQLAQSELPDLDARDRQIAEAIKRAFITEDRDAGRNAILEVRAGTGGEEAALFAADLLRMYVRYAEAQGWNVAVLDKHETGLGGCREVTVAVEGDGVFRRLRYESGGHRVQRVPVTEAGGRIHTSLCTVAVMPEAQPIEVQIRPEDLQIDTYCASGPGGQKVNKTASAVRITHLPTGTIAQSQESPSQHKNRAQALRVLASRIREQAEAAQHSARAQERRTLIGSGDRSERIRTYNFPQNRVTDHRIGLSLYDLESVLMGRLDPLVDALIEFDVAEREKDLSLD